MFLYVDPDAEGDGPVERGENKAKELKRLPLPLRGKLPVFNPKGKTRLEPAVIASMFQENTTMHSGIMCLYVYIGLRTNETLGQSVPKKRDF